MKKKQRRGEFTKAVQATAKRVLGHGISIEELRFMPYLQYVLMNEQRFDRCKVRPDEAKIVESWKKLGYIAQDYPVRVSKAFWDAMLEILYTAYVDIDESEIL